MQLSDNRILYCNDKTMEISQNSYSWLLRDQSDTITNSILQYGSWDKNHIDDISLLLNENSVVLDVGANLGTWTIPLSKKVKQVYAFEPFPQTMYQLCGNVFLNSCNNVTVFPYALSNYIGKNNMLLSEDKNIGGFGLDNINLRTRNEVINITNAILGPTVDVRTLDSLKFDIGKIDFIKIDIEGEELNFLYGAKETLLQYHPIIFYETWNMPCFRTLKQDIIDYLTSLGYNNIKYMGQDNYLAIP